MENGLEGKVVRKSVDLVSCDIPDGKCSVKGDYWKCYLGNERKCNIYKEYLVRHREQK